MPAQFLISTCRNGDLIKPHLKVRPQGPSPQAGLYQGWRFVYQLPKMPLHFDIRLVLCHPGSDFFPPLSPVNHLCTLLLSNKSLHFQHTGRRNSFEKILLRQVFHMKAKIPGITPASQVYKKDRPFNVILSIFLLLQNYLFISIFSRVNSIVFHDDVSNTYLWG